MEIKYRESQGLPQGFRVQEFEPVDIANAIAAGKGSAVTECVNADRRQKVALVEGRADLSDMLVALGFARRVKETVKRGEKEVNILITEGAHIGEFFTALEKGTFTIPAALPEDTKVKFTIPPFTPLTDSTAQADAVNNFLQALADQCGDKDEAGNFITNPPSYVLSLERPEPKERILKLPNWALEGAANIIKNGSQAAWAEKFTNGYTSKAGIAIDPIKVDDFQSVAATGETPEIVSKRNVDRLAVALVAVRKQEIAKSQSEFA